MSSEIIAALIALLGSLIGTFGGIVAGNKLINYRIAELEKKMDKHNNLIERTFKLEERMSVHDEQIKVANHRIDDLERGNNHE